MEEMTAVVNAISTVGFPIIACIFMYRFVKDNQTKTTDALNQLSNTITELKVTMESISDYMLHMRGED